MKMKMKILTGTVLLVMRMTRIMMNISMITIARVATLPVKKKNNDNDFIYEDDKQPKDQ